MAVAQGVAEPVATCDDLGSAGGSPAAAVDDRGHDEVDGDDVDDALGDAGNSFSRPRP